MAVRRRIGRAVSELQGGGRGRFLGAVAVGWFLVLGTRFVVPAVLPTIAAEFEIGNAAAGVAVSILWVTYALMQFPAGALVHRVGERKLLTAAALLSGLGLLAYGVSPVFSLFLVATAAFGLGTGLYGPPRGTVLSRVFDEREGTAFGVVLGAGSVGAAVLPAVAAAVTVRWGWRIALAGAAPLFLVVGLALWLTVPVREPTEEDQSSLATTVRTAVGTIRTPRVALAVAGATLMLFGFQAVTAFLTTYLVDVHEFTQGTAGAVLSLVFVGGAATQVVTGPLADRLDTPTVLTGVALASAAPLVALPLVDGRYALAAVSVAVGIRMASGPLSNAYVVDVLPAAVEGTAWGALRTGYFVVGSLGSTVVGVMAGRGLFAESFFLLAGLTALAAVPFVLLPAR